MQDSIEFNPTHKLAAYGGLEIVRLAPTDQKVTIDYTYKNSDCGVILKCSIFSRDNMTKELLSFTQQPEEYGQFVITPIYNHVDYVAIIKAYRDGSEIASSNFRLFRCGFVPGTVINYIHPEDYTFETSGRSPASPSILKLESGKLLASHDIFWGAHGQNITHVFSSVDGGVTWKFESAVHPCFWTKIFEHRGKVYAMGTSQEYGHLNLFESLDEGKTWSAPARILEGADRAVGGPHKAPMPVVEHNGRLWFGVDHGSWAIPEKHGSGAVSCPVDCDLMDPANWSCTGFARQDATWTDAPQPAEEARGTLEGNLVVGRDGELYNFLRYQHENCTPNYGKAVMIHIDKDNPTKLPTFHKFVDFRGNLTKFDIAYDKKTDKYYSIINDVTGENLKQRNNMSLVVSDDLYSWRLLRGIINYEDICYCEDSTKVGFQYTSFTFDNDDILAATRTAINNAWNFHNANYLTFCRIKNYAITL